MVCVSKVDEGDDDSSTECFGGDGGDGSGTGGSGGGENSSSPAFQNQVDQAAGVAYSRLLSPTCLKDIFGGASSTGPQTPASLLMEIVANNDVVTSPLENGQFAGISATLNAQGGLNWMIVINSSQSQPGWFTQFPDTFNIAQGLPWNQSDQRFYQAMTLVHELAHIWADMFNLNNGFGLQTPDGLNTPASVLQQQRNDLAIFLDCFSGN